MKTYLCPRCHYETKIFCNFKKHLARKNLCESTFSSLTAEAIMTSIEFETIKDKKYICECGKRFSTTSSRSHHKSRCTGKHNEIQELRNEVNALKQMISHNTSNASSQTVNNTTNNITVNQTIHIHDFGHETLDHLPKDFLTHCFMTQDIPMLIENIFFDKDCPENHNVKMKSIKNKMMQVYQENQWMTKQSNDVLNQLVDKGSTLLRKHYRKNTEHIEADMTEEEITEVLDWLCQIVRENEKIRKPIKDNLVAMMDNYRSQVCSK